MAKTVLITGGLGFIGTNITRRLLAQTSYRIRILDREARRERIKELVTWAAERRRVTVVSGDITNKRDIARAIFGVQYVIHLAADTHAGRSLSHALPVVRTNVIGTTMILEASVRAGIERFILFSSSEVYGNKEAHVPMDEAHPLNPVTPYAASKLAADRLAYSYYLTGKLPVTILRPFNAYGPYQHPEKMIPLFITRLLTDKAITLNHGGKPVRDWIHVDDIARAVVMVLNAPAKKVAGGIFNIGTGKSTAVRTVARMIVRALGRDEQSLRVVRDSAPETMGNVGISKRAHRVLGWEPNIPLSVGIKKTVAWYTNNRSWWQGLVRL